MLKKSVNEIRVEFDKTGELPKEQQKELIEEVSVLTNRMVEQDQQAQATILKIKSDADASVQGVIKQFSEDLSSKVSVAKKDAVKFTAERDEARQTLKSLQKAHKKLTQEKSDLDIGYLSLKEVYETQGKQYKELEASYNELKAEVALLKKEKPNAV